jgi:hypothetical protein
MGSSSRFGLGEMQDVQRTTKSKSTQLPNLEYRLVLPTNEGKPEPKVQRPYGMACLQRLRARSDLILLNGAGGPVWETGPIGAECPSRPGFGAVLLFLLVACLSRGAVEAETWLVAGGRESDGPTLYGSSVPEVEDSRIRRRRWVSILSPIVTRLRLTSLPQ